MCGILAIINNRNHSYESEDLLTACNIIRHRGPDDEGFLTWQSGNNVRVWAGDDTAPSTREYWRYDTLNKDERFAVGLGHRRLSILDLSPAGHQPMVYKDANLAITFNGEIYNYLEIRSELEQLGHKFTNKTDTEVILHAWAEWGSHSLDRFNGMFAFVILDYSRNILYAVRDRFGVKPLYYYNKNGAVAFASEIKQIKTLKGFQPAFNEKIAKQFLALGSVDHTNQTFDLNINSVPSGHYMAVSLSGNAPEQRLHRWYELQPPKWTGNWNDAVEQYRSLLADSVKLRLKADVKVGSCLSGGLDSSSIVCMAADLLKQSDYVGLETVTACYNESRYDEWKYAEQVVKKTQAHPHRVFPDFDQLEAELNDFLWHQDEPTSSTSQFSQWAVFKKTHEVGLKVMVDGQGADEQLAGYEGLDGISNDIPFYTGLLKKAKLGAYWDEVAFYKKQHGRWPYSFLLGSLQGVLGSTVMRLFPERLRSRNYRYVSTDWINGREDLEIDEKVSKNLQQNLLRQLHIEPLPSLLRYEDRNSMAWSVESRTPFMDYRLVEFTLGLPERYIYKHGIKKRILRAAMKGILPDAIQQRKDKMGFVTPEEMWLKGKGKNWFIQHMDITFRQLPGIINAPVLKNKVNQIIDGKSEFSSLPWRVSVLGAYINMKY